MAASSQPTSSSLVRSRVANWEQQRDPASSASTSPALLPSSSAVTASRRDVSTSSGNRLAFPTTITSRKSSSSDRSSHVPVGPTTTTDAQSSAALLASLPAYARQPELATAPSATNTINGGNQAQQGTGGGGGGDFASLTPYSLLWAQVRATTAWRNDLQNIYKRSSERFADVCWTTDRSEAGLPPAQARSAESSEEELTDEEAEEDGGRARKARLRRLNTPPPPQPQATTSQVNISSPPSALLAFGNTSISLTRDSQAANLIFAHKAMIYARAPNTFQAKYLHLRSPATTLGAEAASASQITLPSIITHDTSPPPPPAPAQQPSPSTPGATLGAESASGKRRKPSVRGAFPPSSFSMKRLASGSGSSRRSFSSGAAAGSESEGEGPATASGSGSLGKRTISAPRSLASLAGASGSSAGRRRPSAGSMHSATQTDESDTEFGVLARKLAAGGSVRSKKSMAAPSPIIHHRQSIASVDSLAPSTASALSDAESQRTVGTIGGGDGGRSPYLQTNRIYQPRSSRPIFLQDTSQGFLEATLEYLYTAEESMVCAFEFLYEEGNLIDRQSGREERLEKLQQDLTYMWRSKLFSDIRIVLDDSASTAIGPPMRTIPDTMSVLSLPPDTALDEAEDAEDEVTSFSCHRFMLASRSPYFAAQLLSPFADQKATVVHLPSPPFTPAAVHFTLGFIYSGTLSFSHRTFDLATAFQLWRAGAYLQLETMQQVVSALITEEFCHGFQCALAPPAIPGPKSVAVAAATGKSKGTGSPCKHCSRRVPRALAFASCTDVNDPHLLQAAQRAVGGPHFGAYWSKEVGALSAKARNDLVAAVGARLEQHPPECISAVRQLALVGARIDTERSTAWVDALRWMAESVEEKVREVLAAKFHVIVEDQAWIRLIHSGGFSSDVLEKLLVLLTDALTEKRAAQLYQILVGQVLLREDEDAPQGQEKQMVEDARAGILRYLKRRWLSVRAQDGFEGLESWCLKEIADEIDVPVADLLAPKDPQLEGPRSRTGLRAVPSASSMGSPAAIASSAGMRTPRPAGANTRPAVREGEREPGPIHMRAAAVNRSAARVAATGSTPASPIPALAPTPANSPAAMRRAAATAPRAASASAAIAPRVSSRSPTTAPPIPAATASSSASSRRPSNASIASTASLRRPSNASTFAASTSTASLRRPSNASIASTASTSSTAADTSIVRRRVGSTLSVNSVRSTRTIEATAKSAPLSRPSDPNATPRAVKTAPRPSGTVTASSSRSTLDSRKTAGTARMTSTPSIKSVRSTGSLRSAAVASIPPVPPVPKQSLDDVDDQETIRKKNSPLIGATTSTSSSPRPMLGVDTFTAPAPRNLSVTLTGAGAGASAATTCLSHGIPCVVAPKRSNARNLPRFKALVKFIGPLPGRSGSWLGVQVPPPLPAALEEGTPLGIESIATDGTLEGVRYFELASQSNSNALLISSALDGAAPASDSDVDEETRLHREERQRRVRGILAKSSKTLGPAADVGERARRPPLADPVWRRRKREATSGSRAPSRSGSEYGAEDSVGLFIRPEDVLWVVLPDAAE